MPKSIKKICLKRSRYLKDQVIPPIKKLITTRLLDCSILLICSRLSYSQVNLSVQVIPTINMPPTVEGIKIVGSAHLEPYLDFQKCIFLPILPIFAVFWIFRLAVLFPDSSKCLI